MLNQRAAANALFLLLLACTNAVAQDRQMDGAYMVPPKVFVGDRASLVLPLPGSFVQADAEIGAGRLPQSYEVDIYRVALERRPSGNRLVVEFAAYAPGLVELPPISIAGETFTGLKVEISSILEPGESGMVLSGPADPLAIPGTSLLVYGTVCASILGLLLALWAVLWGRRQMGDWLSALKLRWLIISMWGIERRLRRELAKGAGRREILDRLSSEFRIFLSYFSGKNCRAMTASEFGGVAIFEGHPSMPGRGFLGDFFDRCDGIRFSGGEIGDDATLALFADVKSFLKALDRALRKRNELAEVAA